MDELQDFSYFLKKDELDDITLVDINKLLSNYDIVNHGEIYNLQEGNGNWVYAGSSKVIVCNKETKEIVCLFIECVYDTYDKYYKRHLGDWYVATGLSDPDSE